jgi:hypothetical protein
MQRMILLFLFISTSTFFSQSSNLFIPLDVEEAYANGTRLYDGKVSDSYWINHTDYKIDVELFPDSSFVAGSAKIKYFNESPDTLATIVLRLYNNINKSSAIRDWGLSEEHITEGTEIEALKIGGTEVNLNSDKAKVYGTNMIIRLEEKLLPKESVVLELSWQFDIPKANLRMGNYSGDFFIAYWYPQIAVYDDVYGWDKLQYSGTAEFYNDFNNYDVSYTVPSDYIVWSTGDLQNCKNLFHENIIGRIKKAKKSDKIINIITLEDYENNEVLLKKGNNKNVWKFIAKDVPDVAWAVSKHYNWDGASIEVENGRRVFTTAIYPDSIKQNKNAALYVRETIKYMSKVSPGIPYPWSHTTAFANKKKSGGMEFPMMQNNGAPKKVSSSLGLIFHEIAHSYFPFYMGTNERRAAWMDEGWATFFPRRLIEQYDTTSHYQIGRVRAYEHAAGRIVDMPMIYQSYMMTHGESRNNYYNRPAVAYEELRHLLGDELFNKALREYMNRWHEKHPIGYDFFFTFNDVVGEDLSWFWKPWFFELGYPDLSLDDVELNDNGAVVKLSKVGNIPTRIELTFTYEDGDSEVIEKSSSLWKENDEITIEYKTDKKIKSVKLGSKLIPDINRKNNLFNIE